MNQPTPLNLTGGWESIVNKRHNERAYLDAEAHQQELKRSISKVVDLALGATLSVALGFAGLLAPLLAGTAAVLLTCWACFLGGRIWEGSVRK